MSTSETASAMETNIPPIFGDTAQKLIECNQKLSELGIDDTIKIPRLVVIGDQSTGKSSLIEGISGFAIPKSAGTCTRCSLAINLSDSKDAETPWKCTAYIEEKYSYNPQEKSITSTNPLGPWQLRTESQTSLIKVTQDRNELCQLIEGAQKLILNPERESNSLADISTLKNDAERFSPNTIRLDICASGWPNLSFVDSPGVISTAGRGQPRFSVALVENIATEHAKDPNNIILLTLPMTHDFDNSRSFGIVETHNTHARTIAVFTKVDLARQEERDNCLSKYFQADGEEEEFGYGQHIVMLGSGDEDKFFQQQPWCSLAEDVQSRLGTRNLVERIREILFEQTRKGLPENLRSIRYRLTQVYRLLQTLPAPPNTTELPYKLQQQFSDFEKGVQSMFQTGSVSRSRLKSLMVGFARTIEETKPTSSFIAEDEATELEEATKQLSEVSSCEVGNDIKRDEAIGAQAAGKKVKAKLRAYDFELNEIYGVNSDKCHSDTPGLIEPQAIDEMYKMSVQHWSRALDTFIQQVCQLVSHKARECVSTTFGNQKHLPLYQSVLSATDKCIDETFKEEEVFLKRKCKAEKETLFTLDETSFNKYEQKAVKESRQARIEARLKVENTAQEAAFVGRKGKPKPMDEGSLGVDEWDLEIQMFAKVTAHYVLASKRLIDSICQDILTSLIPRLQRELVGFVTCRIGLDNTDVERKSATIAELMCEDHEREAKRQRLLREQKSLEEGYRHICRVLGSVSTDSDAGFEVLGLEEAMDLDVLMQNANENPGASTPTASPKKRKTHNDGNGSDAAESPTKKNRRSATIDLDGVEDYSTSTRTRLTSRNKSKTSGREA
ncbi:hypothetical protein LTR64_003606 [Lithohypha guttulata]|uniref:uncharacterized protein n=1 Tax=Lithohypha guttulata TaxID=1690604 RepID=UPI002DE019AB|nr:hypothetical protein LTR51_000174 [Lithohypha guttulata]